MSRHSIARFAALALAALGLVCASQPAAAAGVRASLNYAFVGDYIGTGALANAVTSHFAYSDGVNFTEGSGANQATTLYEARRTIAASSNETLDLHGVLTDDFGQTVNFTSIKAIVVKASAANTNNVVIGAAGSNPFTGPFGGTTPTIAVPPGGRIVLTAPAAGWTVTDSSSDQLKVANSSSGSGVTYDILLIGN